MTFLSTEITDRIKQLEKLVIKSNTIDSSLYEKYDVKRGLRDVNSNGVVVGLTDISEINAFKMVDGEKQPCKGELYYRGYDINELVDGFVKDNRYGFEEISYLLLFGKLPNKDELTEFNDILSSFRTLPISFVRDIIMKAPSIDIMNVLARSVLTLYSYDSMADDTSLDNVLRQSLQLIAQFPLISVYGYQVYSHYHDENSLIIHNPRSDLSTSENILHMLRADSQYSALEAELLDLSLILHAEHGGGNNSSFTTHVVTSSGTDTYSSVAASLGSLKGPKHGGANIKVVRMFEDMKANIKNDSDGEIRDYLNKLVNKEAFDRSGLIYGMGHAVYSLSDPRAEILKGYVKQLAYEKGLEADYVLYEKIERLAPEVIAEKRKIYKGVSTNIDFYSGFVYNMLGLPVELFTPIFAISRIVGWSSHRMEELVRGNKIIRPGYKSVCEKREYVPINKRK